MGYAKCLIIAAVARIVHATLNKIIVGRVFLVDVQIRLRLEAIAKMYSHHHCLSKSNPGKMIAIFVAKPHASTVFTFVQ